MKIQGDRRHVLAVQELMGNYIQAGRVRLTNTTIDFQPGDEALAMMEYSLDQAHPQWREAPLEHHRQFASPRPHYLLLLQVRERACKQLNIDPRNA